MLHGRGRVTDIAMVAIAVVLALPAVLALAPAAVATAFTVAGIADAGGARARPTPSRMPPRLLLRARPRRDRTLPLRFRLSGRLMPPVGLVRVAEFFRKTFGTSTRPTPDHAAHRPTDARRRLKENRELMERR
jgi:hypothetical protein